MTFTVHKGKHRFLPLYWLRWWSVLINPRVISRRVTFSANSKYTLHGNDQQDNNKLFGVCFGKVHGCSARFGWRYDLSKNKFILSAYCYINGVRQMHDLCEAVANHCYDLKLTITGHIYIFTAYNGNNQLMGLVEVTKGHNRKIAFLLGAYFGGDQTAPHDIKLTIKK